jgi:CRP/FNR family transcriptional regulator, cyclic AMP receptor protein
MKNQGNDKLPINLSDLKEQILLQGLGDIHLQQLKSILFCRNYGKEMTIFKQGDPPEGIYMINRGRVRISASIPPGRKRTLVVFRDGNYFGDISALERRPHSATATTLTDVTLFVLETKHLMCRSSEDVGLACIILKRLAMIASKNLRQMNIKYFRLEESF